MGAPVEVTVEDVTWFAGHGPRPVMGPCPHECRHAWQTVIAWGPDYRHYELVECDDACGGRCRAWVSEYPVEVGGRRTVGTWRRVEPSPAERARTAAVLMAIVAPRPVL